MAALLDVRTVPCLIVLDSYGKVLMRNGIEMATADVTGRDGVNPKR